jgi:hypothetical protein
MKNCLIDDDPVGLKRVENVCNKTHDNTVKHNRSLKVAVQGLYFMAHPYTYMTIQKH